jgi:uncharacterized RDD family membrane protein YckC
MTILDEHFWQKKQVLEHAPKSARIINCLIDSTVCLALIALVWYLFEQKGYRFDGFFGFCIYFAYYFVGEYNLEGKTLGKHFTKTRVLELNGEPLSIIRAVIRTLIRAVLFWSTFFIVFFQDTCLHDTWSKTNVVKD